MPFTIYMWACNVSCVCMQAPVDVDADECVQVDMAVFVDVGHAFHNCVRVCKWI